MRQRLSVFALVMVWATPAATVAQDSVMMVAPPGTTERTLGLLYDANMRPLRESVVPTGAGESVPEVRTYREVRQSASQAELRANARLWGIGASGATGSSQSVGYIRAISLERVLQTPRDLRAPAPEQLPRGAAYYVSRVYFGRMFELRITGTRRSVEADVRILAYGGGGSSTSQSTQTEGYTLGLHPRGDRLQAMAADTPDEILEHFTSDERAVPILIELEALRPTSLAEQSESPPRQGQARYEIQVTRLSFPARKPSGAAWDAFGGAPDMQVTFIQDGQVLRRVTARRNTYTMDFTDAPLGRLVSVSTEHPLVVRFTDIDVAAHDPAGQATVTSLHDGENVVVSNVGARVVLRAVSR